MLVRDLGRLLFGTAAEKLGEAPTRESGDVLHKSLLVIEGMPGKLFPEGGRLLPGAPQGDIDTPKVDIDRAVEVEVEDVACDRIAPRAHSQVVENEAVTNLVLVAQ